MQSARVSVAGNKLHLETERPLTPISQATTMQPAKQTGQNACSATGESDEPNRPAICQTDLQPANRAAVSQAASLQLAIQQARRGVSVVGVLCCSSHFLFWYPVSALGPQYNVEGGVVTSASHVAPGGVPHPCRLLKF